VQTFRNALRAIADSDRTPWVRLLPSIEMSVNSSVSEATGYSPFYLAHLQHPNTALSLLVDRPADASLDERLQRLKFVHARAVDSMVDSNVDYARYYDTRRKQAAEYKVGDLVMVDRRVIQSAEQRQRHANPKMRHNFIGPFPILERLGDNIYRVGIPKTFRARDVVNVSHMKAYDPRDGVFLPPPVYEDDSGKYYAAESVIDHGYNKSKQQWRFLVHWSGYPPEADTWEDEDNLANCRELIDAYFARIGGRPEV
jgi:hypothetical protein